MTASGGQATTTKGWDLASETDICNRALQRLGAKRIVSLTQDTPNARSCNVAYAALRDAELRSNPWNFAIARAQLAASSTAPLFGKAYAYPLPSDFLRLLSPDPNADYTSAIGVDWGTTGTWQGNFSYPDLQIEGQSIFSNFPPPLQIRYVSKVTDPNVMDPLFREALSARIAVELCEEITQSNTKLAAISEAYKEIVAEARRTRALENPPKLPVVDSFITVRN